MVAMSELATICSLTTGDAQPPAESGSALPVGWARVSPRRSSGASHEGGKTGRRARKMRSLHGGQAPPSALFG
jgi:hypothetical protein